MLISTEEKLIDWCAAEDLSYATNEFTVCVPLDYDEKYCLLLFRKDVETPRGILHKNCIYLHLLSTVIEMEVGEDEVIDFTASNSTLLILFKLFTSGVITYVYTNEKQ